MKKILAAIILVVALAAPSTAQAQWLQWGGDHLQFGWGGRPSEPTPQAHPDWGGRGRGCGHVRRECYANWGHHPRRYQRCMMRRGC